MATRARILAVDDQLYFRSFLQELLSGEGYGVETADSGSAALALLERDPAFDAIVIDLVMPGLEGVETVRRIKERWPTKPVIAVTGVGDVRSAVAAMKLGAAEYLLKPIDRDELVQSVHSVLDAERVRKEHARLVDENVAYLSMLSLYERALGLLSLPGAQAAAEWLDLLCLEAHASGGTAFVADAGGAFLRRAVRGASDEEELSARPLPSSEAERAQLTGGEPLLDAGGTLWAPAARAGRLFAVSRIVGAERAAAERALPACRKLGEIAGLAFETVQRAAEAERGSLAESTTGLPTVAFLERVARTEIHKAQRFGRRVALLCIQLEDPRGTVPEPLPASMIPSLVRAVERSLRSTDVLAFEAPGRFWVLVTEADPLGSVVLKRRIAARLREPLGRIAPPIGASLGTATYPLDAASFERLAELAVLRARGEREGLLRALRIEDGTALAQIGARLLERGVEMPDPFVAEMAELLVGEFPCRPTERGLLFLAPGAERPALAATLAELASGETATQVFLATDGDTAPSGSSVHAVPIPADVSPEATWIVRFGEGPQYALVAGPPANGRRLVFHSTERPLVEHLAFRLRAEVGFGMRA
jgi:CheY-like chemotaxis protein/GGDEF domain-containing protein